MPMLAQFAADAVLVLHMGFILFAVFGGLLVLRWRKLIWLHLPALMWGVWIEASHGLCPLTVLENRLRSAARQPGYTQGFIEHYLTPLIYPPGLRPDQQGVLAIGFAVWSLAVYASVIINGRRNAPQGFPTQ